MGGLFVSLSKIPFLTHTQCKTLTHLPCAVTELRKRHAEGLRTAGVNVKRGCITDILEENVVQPLLVSTSAISLSVETVRMILKIDDMVAVR